MLDTLVPLFVLVVRIWQSPWLTIFCILLFVPSKFFTNSEVIKENGCNSLVQFCFLCFINQ